MEAERRRSRVRWNPEEELILLAARTASEPHTRKRLAEVTHQISDWKLVIRHGFVHGLLPLVHLRLQEAGVGATVPSDVAKALHNAYTRSAARTLQLTTELNRILEVLWSCPAFVDG